MSPNCRPVGHRPARYLIARVCQKTISQPASAGRDASRYRRSDQRALGPATVVSVRVRRERTLMYVCICSSPFRSPSQTEIHGAILCIDASWVATRHGGRIVPCGGTPYTQRRRKPRHTPPTGRDGRDRCVWIPAASVCQALSGHPPLVVIRRGPPALRSPLPVDDRQRHHFRGIDQAGWWKKAECGAGPADGKSGSDTRLGSCLKCQPYD